MNKRAWHKTEQRMFEVKRIDDLGQVYEGQSGTVEGFRRHRPEELVLMSPIDLKDSKGRQIYEKDIISCTDKYGHKGRYTAWVGLNDVDYLFPPYEILGNIFEDPDLI